MRLNAEEDGEEVKEEVAETREDMVKEIRLVSKSIQDILNSLERKLSECEV
jgi:hypothetical protein